MLDGKEFSETQLQYIRFWTKKNLERIEGRGWRLDADGDPQTTLENALKKALTLTRQGISQKDTNDGLVVYLMLIKRMEMTLDIPLKERFFPVEIWPDDLMPV